MNKLVRFLILSMLAFSSGATIAQDLFGSQTLDDLPPQLNYAAPEEMTSSGMPKMMLPPEELIPQPQEEPLTAPLSSEDLDSHPEDYTKDDLSLFEYHPALLESTGTWLRRGFWYAEADALILSRTFDTSGLTLAAAATTTPPFQVIGQKNALFIDGSSGAETVPRLNVGRFLFRDYKNRDHTMEFTIFGGGNYGEESQLEGNNLVMLPDISNGNPSFTGAQSMNYDYDTWFNSFELTYNVKRRMQKDRMELEPSGHWVRRAQPSHTNALLAGVRYFNLDEDLNINAFGIPDGNGGSNSETGTYRVQTGNNLIGTELGLSHSYETSRWSITGKVKGGMFLNMIQLKSNFDVTGNIASGSTDLEGDSLAFIGEAAIIGRWHLRPNLSLRTSLEVLQVSGLALAPFQVDFVPSGSPFIGENADAFFLGGAIGLESYW